MLVRHPFVFGLLYGLLMYVIMDYVVVPLSAAPFGFPVGPARVGGLLIHTWDRSAQRIVRAGCQR